jgi:uncharacterized lipoprotein YbaY
MNRQSTFFLTSLLLVSLIASTQPTHAQSWLGFNAAVPKVAPGYGTPSYGLPGVNVSTPGVAVPSLSSSPSLVPATKTWKLGVVVRNTDAGAVVQTVEPGSAAQAANIIPGDVIIAVSGTRIGEFDGRVVDIGEELRRYVDGYGRVSLLMQDSRTRALRASVVTLASTSTTLSGTATLIDQSSLPAGSVLTVQLQNASKPFVEVAGGKAVVRSEGLGPFRFDLNIDPRYLDARDVYQLSGWVSWNNQVLYQLRQPVVVAPASLSQPVSLVLDRAATSIAASGVVSGTTGLPALAPTSLPTNLQPNPVTNNPSNIVTASYPATPALPGAMNTDALNQIFVSLLGRQPSSRELIACQSYMQQGHSLNDVAAKIMATPQVKERYATDALYVQQVIQTLTGKLPTSAEVNYWVGRLQTLGSPEKMIAELLAQNR